MNDQIKTLNTYFWNVGNKSAKERFASAHADEPEQYKKAQRLLHKLGLSHPIDRKSLRAEEAQLEQEIGAMRPDLEAVQAELDELKPYVIGCAKSSRMRYPVVQKTASPLYMKQCKLPRARMICLPCWTALQSKSLNPTK